MLQYVTAYIETKRTCNLTHLTDKQFAQLVGPFETAFVRHMDTWTMERLLRTGRRYSQYVTCPLPTLYDRLLFILRNLKVNAVQVAPAAQFGLSQPNANTWLHVLLPVLHQTFVAFGDVLAEHLNDLRHQFAEFHAPGGPDPPSFYTMAPNGLCCTSRSG